MRQNEYLWSKGLNISPTKYFKYAVQIGYFRGTALGATMATLTASLLVLVSILKDEHKYTVVQHETVDIVSFFTAFGTMAFSYGGHPVFPTVQADMKRPKNFGTACIIGYSSKNFSLIQIIT